MTCECLTVCQKSLSARRAWIEMLIDLVDSPVAKVALRKESVDRNNKMEVGIEDANRRSPQGERG